jgi:hypothetical protein
VYLADRQVPVPAAGHYPDPVRSLILIVLLFSSCSTSTTEPVTALVAHEPTVVASAWLDAVVATDTEALGELVEPVGLAVLAGVENALSSDELAALLDAGLESRAAAEYWRSFRDDFEAIRGISLATLSVAPGEEVPDEPGFTLVELAAESGTGQIVLRRGDDNLWQVDMVATVGPALVGPLGDYLNSAIAGENAEPIAAAYRSGVLPALELAIKLDPQNADLVFETEYIRQLVG